MPQLLADFLVSSDVSGIKWHLGFCFLTAQHVLTSLQACSCNGSPCQVNGSCQQCTQPLEGQCYTGEEAYGAILGTVSKTDNICA